MFDRSPLTEAQAERWGPIREAARTVAALATLWQGASITTSEGGYDEAAAYCAALYEAIAEATPRCAERTAALLAVRTCHALLLDHLDHHMANAGARHVPALQGARLEVLRATHLARFALTK